MTQTTPAPPPFADQFTAQFDAIAPFILAEWPSLDASTLKATGGDFEQVVDVIAIATEHTHSLTRRQLQEIYHLATAESLQPDTPRLPKTAHPPVFDSLSDANLKKTIEQLEAQTEKLLQQFKQEMLPELSAKVQKNPVGSLLIAVGVGFGLGLLLGGRRGR